MAPPSEREREKQKWEFDRLMDRWIDREINGSIQKIGWSWPRTQEKIYGYQCRQPGWNCAKVGHSVTMQTFNEFRSQPSTFIGLQKSWLPQQIRTSELAEGKHKSGTKRHNRPRSFLVGVLEHVLFVDSVWNFHSSQLRASYTTNRFHRRGSRLFAPLWRMGKPAFSSRWGRQRSSLGWEHWVWTNMDKHCSKVLMKK